MAAENYLRIDVSIFIARRLAFLLLKACVRIFTRQVELIARIEVLGADGQVETIEGTTIHLIWWLDRKDWVQLGEIEQGEQLFGGVK